MIAAAAAAIMLPEGVTVECPSDQTFDAEATALLGSPNYGGIFVYSERRIILAPRICLPLAALAGGRLPQQGAGADTGFGIFTLAHELAHATGTTDENAADCVAAKTFSQVAHNLDVDDAATKRLARESAPFAGYDPNATATCWPSAYGLPR